MLLREQSPAAEKLCAMSVSKDEQLTPFWSKTFVTESKVLLKSSRHSLVVQKHVIVFHVVLNWNTDTKIKFIDSSNKNMRGLRFFIFRVFIYVLGRENN
jgi:hypothetical protein